MTRSGPADWERLAEQYKLTPSDVADIAKKLDRLDATTKFGPWTRRTLQLIAEQPGIVSTVLARQIGMERYAFKDCVYKLKRLGLTHSLEVGYSVSARGRAFRKLSAES